MNKSQADEGGQAYEKRSKDNQFLDLFAGLMNNHKGAYPGEPFFGGFTENSSNILGKDYTYVKSQCLAAMGWVGLEFDNVDQIKNLIEEVISDYNRKVIDYLESALSRLSQLKFCSLPIRNELEQCIASLYEQNRSLKEYLLQLDDYVRLVNETEDTIIEQFSKIGIDYLKPIYLSEIHPEATTESVTFETVIANFGDGICDAPKDAVTGLVDAVLHFDQTVENIKSVWNHPIKTGEAIVTSISDAYEKDVVNGNANTVAHFVGRAVGEVLISVAGTKGADKVVKIVKGTKLAKNTAIVLKNSKNVARIEKVIKKVKPNKVADEVKEVGEKGIEGAGKTISYTDYDNIYQSSIHNAGKNKVMLGKYDGGGSTSYINKAGKDYEYFSLGDDWNKIKKQYGYTDDDMFKLFNESFLDDGINVGKTFQFSHNPIKDTGALGQEYQYLLDNNYKWDVGTMTMYPKK